MAARTAMIILGGALMVAACTSNTLPSPTSGPSGNALAGGGPNPLEVSGEAGRKMAVTVHNAETLSSWRSATRDELRQQDNALADRKIALVPLEDGALLIWASAACDRSGTLRATPAEIVVESDPRPGCDAIGNARGIVLSFASGIDPGRLRLVLKPDVLIPEAP
jgi:hypothetical protein